MIIIHILQIKSDWKKAKGNFQTNIEVGHHSVASQGLLLLPPRVLVKGPRYLVWRPAQFLSHEGLDTSFEHGDTLLSEWKFITVSSSIPSPSSYLGRRLVLEFDLPVIDRDPAALTRDNVDLVMMRMMIVMKRMVKTVIIVMWIMIHHYKILFQLQDRTWQEES